MKSYLDGSTRGVVYVSLGTNTRPSEMDKDFLDAFLDAFEKIPHDILWKFDGDSLDRIPNNVKIQKWFPQRDLLGKKKCSYLYSILWSDPNLTKWSPNCKLSKG